VKDVTSTYELLLRSKCPRCGVTVYLAKRIDEPQGNLFALHKEIADGPPCVEFQDDLMRDPRAAIEAVLLLASLTDLEAFVELYEENARVHG